jgi:hypothetical protein
VSEKKRALFKKSARQFKISLHIDAQATRPSQLRPEAFRTLIAQGVAFSEVYYRVMNFIKIYECQYNK